MERVDTSKFRNVNNQIFYYSSEVFILQIIGGAVALKLIDAFASAQFSGEERHQRRLNKVNELEGGEKNFLTDDY